MKSKLIDTAQIEIHAGDGGNGMASFRREKYIPKGGPDGGDGGKGGNIYFVADDNLGTLMDFRSKHKYFGQSGEHGSKKKMFGAAGEDLYIKVPTGTQIYNITAEKEVLIGDLVRSGETVLAARGGKGGKGNDRFKSSTNRTPTQFTKGIQGEEKTIRLEVKLIADIGLIGLPNAGKSTLINQLTNSNAQVANYPFTTITPNLGVTELKDGNKVILADIPGLIEGASEGKGLGDDFLRHIERTRMLVHIIDPYNESRETPESMVEGVLKDYKTIRKELTDYGAGLGEKEEVVAINKIDITEVAAVLPAIQSKFKKEGIDVYGISAVTGEGTEALLIKTMQVLNNVPRPTFEVKEITRIMTINDLPNRRMVFLENNADLENEDNN